MKSVLMVEDDRLYAELIKMRLAGRFTLDHASTLTEALIKLDANSYDAVLLDLGLPDCARHQAVSRIKSSKPTALILVLSGYADPDFIKQAILDNASGFLVKERDDTCPDQLSSAIRLAITHNETCRSVDRAIKGKT